MSNYNSESIERLAEWYLRSNGYFTINNFIVHAGDDETKISNGVVSNHTEIDLLGLRNRNQREISGKLKIQNDPSIIDSSNSQVDFIIVEVKTGNKNKLNKSWSNLDTIAYVLNFSGLVDDENMSEVTKQLHDTGQVVDASGRYSIRFILISEVLVTASHKPQLLNILVDQIIDFIVQIRGVCWAKNNIGIRSIHYQWHPLINKIFEFANDLSISEDQRKAKIQNLLKIPLQQL